MYWVRRWYNRLFIIHLIISFENLKYKNKTTSDNFFDDNCKYIVCNKNKFKMLKRKYNRIENEEEVKICEELFRK